MADRILSSGATVAQSLGIRPPMRQTLTTGLADLEVEKQAALDRIAGLGAASAPRLRPPPGSALQAGPDIYYSPSTDRYAAGGMEFGATEYDVALRAMENLQAPTVSPGGDFQRIPVSTLEAYRQSISEGRGFFGNLGVSAQIAGEGLVGGAGRGLQMLGYEGAGQALVNVGEAIGLSPAEEARSAAISQNQGLLGKIGTAATQSAASLGVSIGAGLAGAAVGGPVGALAGVALSILPMELQSSWEAAEAEGLDPADPNVQSDILMSTLLKTGFQTAGPYVLTRGFSPALRRVVDQVTRRTFGQRIAYGVGAGALEGSAEALAQITDRVAFDPELRAEFNEADWAALAPLIVNKYGEEALVAFGAGFLLGGPLGALGTREVQAAKPEDTPPRRDVNTAGQTDLLSGASLEPQAAPQLALPAPPLALPAPPLALPTPDRSAAAAPDVIVPPAPPGSVTPAAPAAPAAPTAPTAPTPATPQSLGLEGPVAEGFSAAAQRVSPVGYTGPQAEMFTPTEMGVGRAAAARLQPEQALRPSTRGLRRDSDLLPPVVQPAVEAQPGLPLQMPAATDRPMEGPLNALRQRIQEAEEARAQREAGFAGAEQQRMQQDVDQLRRQQEARKALEPGGVAVTEWDALLEAKGHTTTLDLLTPEAQQQWADAVARGTADEALYNDLRKKVVPNKLRQRKAAEARRAAAGPEPKPEPEPRPTPPKRGDLAAQAQAAARGAAIRKAVETGKAQPVSPRGKKDADGLTVHEVATPDGEIVRIARTYGVGELFGWHNLNAMDAGSLLTYLGDTKEQALEALTRDTTPPTPPKGPSPKGGKLAEQAADKRARQGQDAAKLKGGETGAVQEQGAKKGAMGKGPEARPQVRGGDTQGQEAAGARQAQVQDAEVVQRQMALPPEQKTALLAELDTDTDGLIDMMVDDPARVAAAIDRVEARARAPAPAPTPAPEPVIARGDTAPRDMSATEAWDKYVAKFLPVEFGLKNLGALQSRWAAEVKMGRGSYDAARKILEDSPTYNVLEAQKLYTTSADPQVRYDALSVMLETAFTGDPTGQKSALLGNKSTIKYAQDFLSELSWTDADLRALLEFATLDSTVEARTAEKPNAQTRALNALLEGTGVLGTAEAVAADTKTNPATKLTAEIKDFNENPNSRPSPSERKYLQELVAEFLRYAMNNMDAWGSLVEGNTPIYQYIKGRDVNLDRSTGTIVPNPNATDPRTQARTTPGLFSEIDYNDISNALDADGKPLAGPMPRGKQQLTIKSFLKRLRNAPRVYDFKDQADLRQRNPDLYRRAAGARAAGDFDTAMAAGYSFGDGEVIIFTDRIANEQHLKFVLAHETFGHYGLRGVLPATQFDSLMEGLYNDTPSMQMSVDAAMAANPDLGKAEAVEEYLSDYAADLDVSIVRRVWNAIKGVLNKLGLSFGDDSVRYVLDQARRYARSPRQGFPVDLNEIARRAHAVETGLASTGRYKTATDYVRDMRTQDAVARMGLSLPKDFQEGLDAMAGKWKNFDDMWRGFKSTFLSLSGFDSRTNPGLKRLYDILQRAGNIAMSVKNQLNETMRPALDRAFFGFGGMTNAEYGQANEFLHQTRIRAIMALRERPADAYGAEDGQPFKTREQADAPAARSRVAARFKTGEGKGIEPGALTVIEVPGGFMLQAKASRPLLVYNKATGKFERTAEVKRLDDLYRLKLEEARDGFSYTFTNTDENGNVIGEPEVIRVPGIPGLTKDSKVWRAYEAARKAYIDTEMHLLEAHLSAGMVREDTALKEIGSVVPDGELTTAERALMRMAIARYQELYNEGSSAGADGAITYVDTSIQTAKEFAKAFNMAVIANESADVDTEAQARNNAVKQFFDQDVADDIVAQIEAFKKRAAFTTDRYIVQNKIIALHTEALQQGGASDFASNSIANQYSPIVRTGDYETRLVPKDAKTGRIVSLDGGYKDALLYSQFGSRDEALQFAKMVGEAFKDTPYKVRARGADGEMVEMDVVFEPVVDRVLVEAANPLGVNLNEFIAGLNYFDINLPPAKREEIITAMTAQDAAARRRLRAGLNPGDARDAIAGIAKHIDGRASTIAKVYTRPLIDELMNPRIRGSNELWSGDGARVERLRTAYEAALADPGANDKVKAIAKREYDEALMMYRNTNPAAGESRKNEARNKAARTLAFLDQNASVNESDFEGAGMIAAWRSYTSLVQLGGSLATGLLNPVSVYTNGVPFLASYNEKTAFGGGFGAGAAVTAVNTAFAQVGIPGMKNLQGMNTAEFWDSVVLDEALQTKYRVTKREAQMIAREIREGRMIPAQSNAMVGTSRGRTTRGSLSKAIDLWMSPFNLTEQASRRAFGLAAFRLEYARQRQGIDPTLDPNSAEFKAAEQVAYERAVDFAGRALDLALGDYSVLNRPAFFRSGLPGILYMYKVFPTTSIQMFRNLSFNGKMGMLAALWLLGGVAAFPFAEDFEDLFDTLLQTAGVGEGSVRAWAAKRLDEVSPGLTPLILKGVLGNILPGDIAGRVSLSVIPGTEALLAGSDLGRVFEEILGPMPSALLGTAQFAADLVRAPFSETVTMEKVFREAPVTGLRMAADAYAYTQSGAIIDRRGYIVAPDVTVGEIIWRLAGFYPRRAAESFGNVRIINRIADYRREAAAAYRQEWVTARIRNDRTRMREIEQAVREWNNYHRGSPLAISNFRESANRAYREAVRPATERSLRAVPQASRSQLESRVDALTY